MALVWAFTGPVLESIRRGPRDWFVMTLAALPWLGMVMFARLGKQRFLADEETFLKWLGLACRWVFCGLGLAGAQLAAGYCLGSLAIRWAENGQYVEGSTWFSALVYAIVGGLVTWPVMAVYLVLCTLIFDRHHNEAFSALRSERWKNFLRLTLDKKGKMTVHAVGLDQPNEVPCGSMPHLIERFDI
ncbi:MAG: hypothetical protein FJW39_35360 [Acidobacteria bacterium]|nr:hypothetical protein [Acidobacteriota bacterium]